MRIGGLGLLTVLQLAGLEDKGVGGLDEG